MPNPTLKVIQKNAVQSYFQRQQASVRENVNGSSRPKSLHFVKSTTTNTLQRSSLSGYVMIPPGQDSKNSTSLTNAFDYKTSVSTSDLNLRTNIDDYFDQGQNSSAFNLMEAKDDTPPRPPPRNRQSLPARRTSSASEYSSLRDKILTSKQHLSKDLLGPMILGSVISIDDWVPERPPKNPALRIPSPELPPPPPPLIVNDINHELVRSDDPLPPPPTEDVLKRSVFIDKHNQNKQLLSTPCRRNSFAGQSYKPMYRSNGLENLTKMPPAIPKKPFDLQKRSSNPILNSMQTERFAGNSDQIQNQSKVPLKLNSACAKVSARKRPYNMKNTLGIPLAQERQIPPAPPLKPRTLIQQ